MFVEYFTNLLRDLVIGELSLAFPSTVPFIQSTRRYIEDFTHQLHGVDRAVVVNERVN
jgi:hypothetical protein